MVAPRSLPFLWPMALPRPATLHRFLGLARISTKTQKLANKGSSTTRPLPPLPTTVSTLPKPYLIARAGPGSNFPVYNLTKRGGNMKLTRVRKIEGDVTALRDDLRTALALPEEDITINPLTRHIMVKGHWKAQIEEWIKASQL